VIYLPLFERLDISGFDMYPGDDSQGVNIDFNHGLTLVIGANGLGKTTLINILYRMLTGPYDIAAFEQRELGTAELKPTFMRERRLYLGRRVPDGARDASARLLLHIGKHKLTLERSLHDLSLLSVCVDEEAQQNDETELQKPLSDLVGVSSFGDLMLVLQQLVFYFETRRELVWDSSAQRELLRVLFLSQDDARRWSEESRRILELDTLVRNSTYIRQRLEKELTKSDEQIASLPEVRAELKTLGRLQDVDTQQRASLNTEIDSAEAERQATRLRLLSLGQTREGRFRALERARLIMITAAFPSQSETTRYILGQLMSDGLCLVCGSEAPLAERDLKERLAHRKCIVCSSPIKIRKPAALPDKELIKLQQALDRVEKELVSAQQAFDDATSRYDDIRTEIVELNASISKRSARIDALVAALPPEEAQLHGKRSELAGWKAREDELRKDVTEKRARLKVFVDEMNLQIVSHADKIRRSFHHFAKGLLVESCSLVWQPTKRRLGQTGELFDFPAFELSMSGAGFADPIRRGGPDDVSESQREFIDLAFRMALIDVGGHGHSGSLVIDAPESSLDLVFQARAAKVLIEFANARKNRLIVTSNLVAGVMLKALVASLPRDDRPSHVVNLFNVAERTAAVHENWPAYQKELKAIFK
jgi:hypothetical protein